MSSNTNYQSYWSGVNCSKILMSVNGENSYLNVYSKTGKLVNRIHFMTKKHKKEI